MALGRIFRILGEQPHPARFLMSRILMRAGISERFSIPQNGFRLRFYPTSLSASLWVDPHSRVEDEEFFRRYLRAGDTVVDVGANVGSLTLTAASVVGSAGHVYAVEAHPRTFGYLRGNLAHNAAANVTPFNTALGKESGTLHFSDLRDDDINRVAEEGGGITVPVARADELPVREGRVALLKVDVEGYEWFVFQGATALLERTECVYYESYEPWFARFGYTTGDVLRELAGQGFTVLRAAGAGEWAPVPPGHTSTTLDNLVAARDPRALAARAGMRLRATDA
jgi:FkbM family methyltransferase